MKIKTNTGQEIDLEQFENASYGEFSKYVQQNIDPQWGKPLPEEGRLHKFEVRLTGTATIEVEAIIDAEAETEEEAKGLAIDKVQRYDWETVNSSFDDVEDIEVGEIRLIDEEG